MNLHLPIGIEWDRLNYDNKKDLYNAVSHLLSIIICTVAPEKFILYGDFFNEKDAPYIKERTEKLLRGDFIVNLETAVNLENNYESGLTAILLEKLYAALFGKSMEV